MESIAPPYDKLRPVNSDGPAAPMPLADVLRNHRHIAESLLCAAQRHARSPHDAEDLFQETIRVGLGRPNPPDPADLVTVRRFFGSILNSLGANRRRAARRHAAQEYDDDASPPSGGMLVANPERALLEREEQLARLALKTALRAALAEESVARQMFDLVDAGVRGSGEIALRLGCSVEDVYRARRRIVYHARRLKEQARDRERRAS